MTARPVHNDALTEALADLTPRQEQAFYHILSCDPCRDRARTILKPEIEDLEDTVQENPAFKRLMSQVPRMLSADARDEADEQIRNLLRARAEGRGSGGAPASASIETRELANAVLLRIRDFPPTEALCLCDLLDEMLSPQDPSERLGRALLQVRTTAARANAQRALGRRSEAEATFRQALELLTVHPWPTLAGAELLRGYGVLAWDRGELDLAEAFLRQSARVRAEMGDPDEEAESWVLLGLVVAERGAVENAVRLLRLGRKDLSRRSPWLSLQARYENARLAGLLGLSRACELLEEALTPEEAAIETEARAQWLKGRGHAAAGDRAAAEPILEGARARLLAEKAFAPAVLCTVDLALLLLEEDRMEEVEHTLLADLAARFAEEPAMPRIQQWALNQLRDLQQHRLGEEAQFEAEANLRRLLRMAGHSVLVEIP